MTDEETIIAYLISAYFGVWTILAGLNAARRYLDAAVNDYGKD